MLSPPRLMAMAGIVPLPIAARVADLLFLKVLSSHPMLFDRLGDYMSVQYAFVPTDFAFSFVVRPSERSVRTFRRGTAPEADATISGPFVMLLALAEGRVDGDALFFARKLLVSGDMEAILALRNALDDSGIDLVKSTSALAGPLGRSAKGLLAAVRREALRMEGLSWN